MLTFGFKVFGLAFANGSWQIHGVAPAGSTAFFMGHEPAPVLLATGLMMDFPAKRLGKSA
jgi:hypothetical protein